MNSDLDEGVDAAMFSDSLSLFVEIEVHKRRENNNRREEEEDDEKRLLLQLC